MQAFAIGTDSFGRLRSENLKFIDKSLFINEIFDKRAISVTLITRPRRFGKTLNLSMLHHFLSDNVFGIETPPLFEGLIVFGLFGADLDAVMSLLLAAGYLKALSRTQTEMGTWLCELTIPNHEVMAVYRTCIMTWFATLPIPL
ncbi:MAG: hypothetical protein A3J38_08275 [Gammaproteobacteria bacterium RIFCSPHIGHO2_12_FULL_45_9]|nr:MAG: hypothetical protein A3J38_08275 [Gammaproteobacteria bacterium RIFCSPHIGHO2_12_FULL_45_9]